MRGKTVVATGATSGIGQVAVAKLAAMGARESGLIIALIQRLRAKGGLAIVMIMHNYAQTLDLADRIMLMQRGTVTFEKRAAETSVEELLTIVRRDYRAGD